MRIERIADITSGASKKIQVVPRCGPRSVRSSDFVVDVVSCICEARCVTHVGAAAVQHFRMMKGHLSRREDYPYGRASPSSELPERSVLRGGFKIATGLGARHVASGDKPHPPVVRVRSVNGNPGGNEARSVSLAPVMPVAVPTDAGRGSTRRLVQNFVLPQPKPPRPQEVCSDLDDFQVGGQGEQRRMGPPRIDDLPEPAGIVAMAPENRLWRAPRRVAATKHVIDSTTGQTDLVSLEDNGAYDVSVCVEGALQLGTHRSTSR